MLNNSGESGHPCLSPDLTGKAFNLSLLTMVLAVGVSYISFTVLGYVPSILNLLSGFYHQSMLNFVKSSFYLLWDDRIVFLFLKIYLFLDRVERRKRRRETSMCGCLPRTPTGDMALNPGMYPDWELNRQPFGSQAGTQSTEPHQPWHNFSF